MRAFGTVPHPICWSRSRSQLRDCYADRDTGRGCTRTRTPCCDQAALRHRLRTAQSRSAPGPGYAPIRPGKWSGTRAFSTSFTSLNGRAMEQTLIDRLRNTWMNSGESQSHDASVLSPGCRGTGRARGSWFWRSLVLGVPAKMVVVVPARNEEHRLRACLTALRSSIRHLRRQVARNP